MKRWIVLALCLALLLSSCVVTQRSETERMEQAVKFYYCRDLTDGEADDQVIDWEYRDLGENNVSMKEMLKLYFQGPESQNLHNPFPTDLSVVYASMSEGRLLIRTDETLNRLTGVRRSIAAACLAMTVTQFPSISSVQILAGDRELTGDWSGRWTPEDFVLEDDSATSDATTVKVYVGDVQGRYLTDELRTKTLDAGTSAAEFVMTQLLEGPNQQGHESVLPAGTRLNEVHTANGLCEVDLSEEFLLHAPSRYAQARLAVYAIVNSLTELTSVQRVLIRCDGQEIGDFGGMDLRQSLYRDETVLAQDQNPDQTADVSFYLPAAGKNQLAELPVVLRRTMGRTLASDVLQGLFQISAPAGYANPFPEGTTVLGSAVKDGLCTVTLSSDFSRCDADPQQARLAVRSLVATLCALDGIERVHLQIHNGTMTTVDLSAPITVQPLWLLP